MKKKASQRLSSFLKVVLSFKEIPNNQKKKLEAKTNNENQIKMKIIASLMKETNSTHRLEF